jgi:hypothetical protein
MVSKKSILMYFMLVLARASPSGELCSSSLDCEEGWEICDENTSLCAHKGMFPLKGMEVLGCLMIFLALTYSNAGGLGGGGIIIPVVMVFFGFNMKETIANTISTVFTSALVRYS